MKVEIFTTVGNMEYIVPLFLKHYKSAFPDAVINVAACNSTDNSVKLCEEAGCNISFFHGYRPYKTESILTFRKNNCWKKSDADWIIVCDIDELCHISQNDLKDLDGVDIIRFKGYNIFDEDEVQDPELMVWAAPSVPYSKSCMFRKSIKEINYKPGAHLCNPPRTAKILEDKYMLLHYKKGHFNFENYCATIPYGKKTAHEVMWKTLRKGLTKVL
jgi:hypothetical protein